MRGGRRGAALLLSLSICGSAAAAEGVKLVGRWLTSDDDAAAAYAGSTVLLSFTGSSRVAADFTVSHTQLNRQDLYISVTVDGGRPLRIGLSPGVHPGLALATGLSTGAHVVAIRKEGEPLFGVLHFSKPALDPKGSWRTLVDDRPIVEVIGDSDATGICALGPDSPFAAARLFTSAWASEAHSWVGLLEAGLAGIGHPVDMVDLAVSGSTAKDEAASYDYTAFSHSDARFQGYASPGRQHASLALLWGGANDRHGGGDTVGSGPVNRANLSSFQAGIFDQLTKILARNPGVKILLLEYIDPAIPVWRPAYEQVMSLFSEAERQQMFLLAVRDPDHWNDACDIDPNGHPNLAMHTAWATQILAWMVSNDMWQRLGFPAGEQWKED
ncbi:MAG: hypothetical protein QOD56_2352 [Gammaproteobacteria bacterium]|nr:hypothetical protein [Gammaproteobacteria bacterium]